MAQGREAANTVGGIIATGQPPPDPTNIHADTYAPLMQGMKHAFIEIPYQLEDWGQIFDDPNNPSPCLNAYRQIVASGPHGTDDKPRDMMLAAGPACQHAKDFNYTPTSSRMTTAVIALILSIFVLILAVVMAFGLILCQIALLVATITAPFVFAVAVVPGGGRRWLYKWVGTVLAAFLGSVVAISVLSLLMVAIGAVSSQAGTDGQPLFAVMGIMDFLVVAAIVYWFKWRHSSKKAARRVAAQLAAMQYGASGNNWLAPHGDGGGNGNGVAQGIIRGAAPRGSATGVAAAALSGAGAGAMAGQATRVFRQRVARSRHRRRGGP
jgi:hypothetical protein